MDWLVETWNAIYAWVLGAIGGAGVVGIIWLAIKNGGKSIVKTFFKKMSDEKFRKDLASELVEYIKPELVDTLKNVSFNQSIQPVVESELKKVDEFVDERIKEQLAEVKGEYDKVIEVLEKIYAVYENSCTVAQSKKDDIQTAIDNAKETPVTTQEIKFLIEEERKAQSNEDTTTVIR